MKKRGPIYYEILCKNTIINKINKTEFEIIEEKKTCQSKGGINCEGCCKSPIFSSNVFTCCVPDACDERIQMDTVLEGLDNVTIERFPKGNYGVWYGEKDIDFGNRKYVDAEQIDNKKYKFIIEKKKYEFIVKESGCSISIIEDVQITNQTFGALFIQSEPTNTSVYLDGVYKGLTPLTANELNPSVYEVKLSKEGYQDSTASWSVAAGETKNLSIALKPLP